MDILDIITSRRSVRKFTDRAVSNDLLTKVLEAGRWAPSGQNNQPWRFAVIESSAIKAEIAALTHYSRVVHGAKMLIAVFLHKASSYHRIKDAQAIGACMQNMLLEIHALGLGGVWLGEIIKSGEELKKILKMDADLELMAVIAMGYPAESPKKVTRKELADLVICRQ